MSQSLKRQVNSPSFSSSLLDKVFRSIDESDQPTTTNCTTRSVSSDRLAASSDKKPKKIGPNRRKLDTEPAFPKPERNRTSRVDGPVSTSSDHADDRKPKPNDGTIGVRNLKPIRTNREGYRNSSKPRVESASASSPSSSFQNAKIRAQKMYGDLKDAKEPISPGGRLTRFITSLFSKRSSSSSRKSEKLREAEGIRTRHEPVTTCYSASSYYRSCLRNKPTDSSRSSVRFCPVNIVIGDDERQENPRLVASRKKCELDGVEERTICKQRQAQSNLKELLKKYDRNGVLSIYDGKLSDEDDDDDDGGSCASSDLFELDHIGGNVSHSIINELPVYESTQFHSKNPAVW